MGYCFFGQWIGRFLHKKFLGLSRMMSILQVFNQTNLIIGCEWDLKCTRVTRFCRFFDFFGSRSILRISKGIYGNFTLWTTWFGFGNLKQTIYSPWKFENEQIRKFTQNPFKFPTSSPANWQAKWTYIKFWHTIFILSVFSFSLKTTKKTVMKHV